MTPRVWDSGKLKWQNEIRHKKLSLHEKLQNNKDKIAKTEQEHNHEKPKRKNHDKDI